MKIRLREYDPRHIAVTNVFEATDAKGTTYQFADILYKPSYLFKKPKTTIIRAFTKNNTHWRLITTGDLIELDKLLQAYAARKVLLDAAYAKLLEPIPSPSSP